MLYTLTAQQPPILSLTHFTLELVTYTIIMFYLNANLSVQVHLIIA